jgi:hypothetical protein
MFLAHWRMPYSVGLSLKSALFFLISECIWKQIIGVHPLYEPRYVIPRVANLTEENTHVCMSELPIGVRKPEICLKQDLVTS